MSCCTTKSFMFALVGLSALVVTVVTSCSNSLMLNLIGCGDFGQPGQTRCCVLPVISYFDV